MALGATGLTLATSWGGTQYAWGSATIIGLLATALVSGAIVGRTGRYRLFSIAG